MTVVHDFRRSLALSHSYSDAAWWLEVYRKAFPTLKTAADVREFGWHQQAGIDRVLTLANSQTVRVDEKVREKDWPDFALEFFSDKARRVPGWIAKDLGIDFIAYAFVPSRTCHLLPFLGLRQAWRLNRREWVSRYPRIEAKNKGYVTESLCVPKDVVHRAIADAMIVTWSPAAEQAA